MVDSIDLITICVSAITFVIINQIIVRFLRPQSIGFNTFLDWKFRNIFTSLCHSFTVGFGILYVIIDDRSILSDMLSAESSAGDALICISTGYFVYDLMLSLTNLQYPGRVEIIVHHVMTLSCLTVSLYERRFMAYCMVGLTVEISSFFIHVRELLLLSGALRTSVIYYSNSILTVFTLIVFRFLPLSWISYGLYTDRQHIELALILMAVLFLVVIFLVSSVLLYRVVNIDFNSTIARHMMHTIVAITNKFHFKCSSKVKKFF
ncbi:unnamed protein product [Oppiella nova]|uniref:TLC domain-containing protein n=1 Tax=Oppiella nova TaxID=334625 RepID=A0A7R9QCL6_9ACAR|nr:unnamed protein product [Oppiella nova]CAG2163095.1 unnamed protein product [Oppiella nova]